MKKWMKVIGGVMVAALVVTVFAGVALAQGPGDDGDGVRNQAGLGRGPAWGFVDEDGDGICDLHVEMPGEGYGQGHHWSGQANGAQGRNTRLVDGSGYGDGECDGTPEGAQTMGRGMGRNRWAAGQ